MNYTFIAAGFVEKWPTNDCKTGQAREISGISLYHSRHYK
ncbi:hypothetical protein imdm_1730 [gamma proteobacterium IMCC2047]|nr:hypothetical protein imdm_1730 [gamma proteobacterium IMCC2047]